MEKSLKKDQQLQTFGHLQLTAFALRVLVCSLDSGLSRRSQNVRDPQCAQKTRARIIIPTTTYRNNAAIWSSPLATPSTSPPSLLLLTDSGPSNPSIP